MFFLLGSTVAQAGVPGSKYVLVYDQLYSYGETTSQVIERYIKLKSEGNNVLLLQTGNMKKEKIDKDTDVIVVASSFDSMEAYKNAVDYYALETYKEEPVLSNENEVMIGINDVYPFSDLNKLMDIAEDLNGRGIRFICTIMPVYENYELEAFDHYIEVLKYVRQMGGEFFVHYPIINEVGAYDADIKSGMERSVAEYRDRGFSISGIELTSDALLMNPEIYENLGLNFILVEKSEKKVDSDRDLLKVSQELNRYVFIKGFDEEEFDFFQYLSSEKMDRSGVVLLSLEDNIQKMDQFLTGLNREKIKIHDFEPEMYHINNTIGDTITDETKDPDAKSELDRFREEELKKIKGENIEQEQETEKHYDISGFGSISIRIAGVILLLLAVQVLIGRRFDYRKFFRN